MSLYSNLINESLEEDNKANREVVERLRKNFIDRAEQARPEISFDKQAILVFKRYLNNFSYVVFSLLNRLETDSSRDIEIEPIEYTPFIQEVVLEFNRLILFINKMGYNNVTPKDKAYIEAQLTKFINPLDVIITKLNENEEKIDPTVVSPILEIKQELSNKIYDVVGSPQVSAPKTRTRGTQVVTKTQEQKLTRDSANQRGKAFVNPEFNLDRYKFLVGVLEDKPQPLIPEDTKKLKTYRKRIRELEAQLAAIPSADTPLAERDEKTEIKRKRLVEQLGNQIERITTQNEKDKEIVEKKIRTIYSQSTNPQQAQEQIKTELLNFRTREQNRRSELVARENQLREWVSAGEQERMMEEGREGEARGYTPFDIGDYV